MGIYKKYVFPWILEQLDGPEIQSMRDELVAGLEGNILEIGLGTGKMLPHYPSSIEKLSAVEPYIAPRKKLAERVAAVSFPVEITTHAGEDLPFADNIFDAVVVALVLCSVKDPARVLREIHRVLRPGGACLFLEHVASDKPGIRGWQDRLNGLQNWIGCGCNLNRPTADHIQAAGFEITRLTRRISKDMPLSPELFPLIIGRGEKSL